jgi:hypothetical protein
MMLNKPMVDWLSLTTFETKQADAIRYLFWDDNYTDTKRMQYKGVDLGNIFLGAATQNGKPHYLFQASGERADEAFTQYKRNFGPYDWNVTRIDLQVTIPVPPHYDSRQFYDDMTAWDGHGKPRKAAIVQSGDGLDTVYIGSRQSDRFTRVYVKPLDSGLRALRFEVEYKGDHAHRVANDCREFDAISGILGYEINSLPKQENNVLRAFLRVLGTPAFRPTIRAVASENSSLDWLRQQVTPTLERLSNSHEHGQLTKKLIESWYRAFVNQEKGSP